MNLSTALQLKPGDVVALVGGGGKSSAMFRLGAELSQAGRRVLLATTTRIFATQISLAPAFIRFNPEHQSLPDILPKLKTLVEQHGHALLIGPTEPAGGKACGVEPETINALAQSGLFDTIVIEADGSRMRPFKAPAGHEPVIPRSVTLAVPIVGLDALNAPLTAETVHRPELVSRLSGQASGQPVTADVIAAVLAHPEGGLKSVPPAARVIPLLNKFDLAPSAPASDLAEMLLRVERVDSVAVAILTDPDPVQWVQNRVAAVVLAAGAARRFGAAKQLAPWQGKPMFLHAVDAALNSRAGPVVVVLGAYAAECRRALGTRPVTVVENPGWAAGQSASMKAGLAALPPTASAAIFPLADQPLVSAAVINAVIARHQRTLAPVVWPEFAGKRGNPVLFHRRLFAEMERVQGDVGAKPVLLAHRAEAAVVAVDDEAVLIDIDTPDDLAGNFPSATMSKNQDTPPCPLPRKEGGSTSL